MMASDIIVQDVENEYRAKLEEAKDATKVLPIRKRSADLRKLDDGDGKQSRSRSKTPVTVRSEAKSA